MVERTGIQSSKDKTLFTPGPLTTSMSVKQAQLRDLGSRDLEFITTVKQIRERLVRIGQCNPNEYTAILIQGSGTFGIEAGCQRRILDASARRTPGYQKVGFRRSEPVGLRGVFAAISPQKNRPFGLCVPKIPSGL